MSQALATVMRPGLTTIQDGGRRGHAAVGVPRSGAWHRERYLLATALLAGAADDRVPTLELLGGTLELLVQVDTALAVVGPAEVVRDGEGMPVGAVLEAQAGARWSVAWRGPGPAYVALIGWRPRLVLGSASTDTFSRLGGAVLSAGMELGGEVPSAWGERLGAFLRPGAEDRSPLCILSAGHPGLAEFAGGPHPVRSTSRSGVRLAPRVAGSVGMAPSSPMTPGAVQLTPSGEAIVLGPDGGITGGYPVVGVVAASDRDRLSLLAPGDLAEFRVVDVAEANLRHRRSRERMRRMLVHVGTLN